MTLRTNRSISWGLFLVVLMEGCATSPAVYQPDLHTTWQARAKQESTAQPAVAVELYGRRLLNGEPSPSWWLKWRTEGRIKRCARRVLQEFSTFAIDGHPVTPYRLVIEATVDRQVKSYRLVVTVLSLGTIPSPETLLFELEAKLYEGPQLVKSYRADARYDASVNLATGLMAYGRIHYMAVPVMEEAFRNLFIQMERDRGVVWLVPR